MRGNTVESLPENFELRRGARGQLALRRGWELELERSGFTLEGDGVGRADGLAGRKAMLVLASARGELVVRRFTHGGLLRWLTGARFADPERPFRELSLSERLARAGVRTPEVVAARARRAPLWGWELALVTRRVPGASDGGELLARSARGELGARERGALFERTGRLVARLHALGFRHADLHPKNLLFEGPDGGVGDPWLLDLDRSRWSGPLTDAERWANVARLLRYAERRRERGEFAYSRTDLARFLAGYATSPEARRRDARGILAAFRRSLGWHRLAWRVERT